MLKPNNDTRPATEELVLMRLVNWAERVGTMIVETPQGDWYAVMWKFDGSAPILQYCGATVFAAHQALNHRVDAVYGPRPDPETYPDQE